MTTFTFLAATASAILLAAPPPLHTDGTRIVDDAGRTVVLRGTNLGGWLLNELWLTGFRPWEVEDDAGVRERLRVRFGRPAAEELLTLFRDSYLTEADFDLLRDMGINCVRLPFYYRILEDDENPYVYRPDGWKRLDFVIDACRERGLYVILDLHGAPGGQSSSHTTGEAHRNELWVNEEYRNRTVELWRAVASRYRTESTVAGYNFLNEPWGNYENDPRAVSGHPTRNELLDLYDRIYDAVRAVGGRHIIFLENRLTDP